MCLEGMMTRKKSVALGCASGNIRNDDTLRVFYEKGKKEAWSIVTILQTGSAKGLRKRMDNVHALIR